MLLTGLPPLPPASIPAGAWATLLQLDAQVWLVDAAGRRQPLPEWPPGVPRPENGAPLPVRVLARAPLQLVAAQPAGISTSTVEAVPATLAASGETAAWRAPALAPWLRQAGEVAPTLLAGGPLWPFVPAPVPGRVKVPVCGIAGQAGADAERGELWCVFVGQDGRRVQLSLAAAGGAGVLTLSGEADVLQALRGRLALLAAALACLPLRMVWQTLDAPPVPGHGRRGRVDASLARLMPAVARRLGLRRASPG
ncbi:hypothetical protein [Crenobacter caeni]|uniref:Uncharacterized protein n=1 Tax=Crenobacter caeni TaxID=2705474 RepID=A0A6B2KRX6_9NEIS|nr:hypothetical protein [Crenobacter caeni]NDV12811.1 hypothetical protein [Crenobacter caeni]